MKAQDFNFELPAELIAQYPKSNRTDSRLLVFDRQQNSYEHSTIKALDGYLDSGDLLVLNDTKVMAARCFGHKKTGGKVELLIERIVDEQTFLSHIKASKAPVPGTEILLDGNWKIVVLGREDDLFLCKVRHGQVEGMMQEIGHIPLPPYIQRPDDKTDSTRYQTVYAKHDGSVAAPTAGLHFDDELLQRLKDKGIQIAYLTLHVGAGTFQPVRVEDISKHHMHLEQFSIDASLCDLIHQTKANNKRVIAVGTTVVRSLESAALGGTLKPYRGETDIFIYPGFSFRICDGMITNFHLPKSTLLMLVCAFIGQKQALDLYQAAIDERYRFFSYGDATLLL